MGAGEVMPDKVYLDESGRPIKGTGVRLDDEGNPIEVDLAALPTARPERTWADTASDLAGGVKAGIAHTVFGGGDLIRRATGMPRIINEPDVQQMMTPPESTPGRLGYTGEQIGEFFLPTGMAGRAARVAEALKSGALTLAQGGTQGEAGVSAALSAILPGAGAAKRASEPLKASAEKSVAQALGATKEWAKVKAAELAPEMIERGVKGSRAAMLSRAESMVQSVGAKLGAAEKAAAAAGESVSGDVIRGNIQLASDALKVKDAAGKLVTIPGTEQVINRLDKMDKFVESLGPDVPLDKAIKVRRTWDKIVSKAGLFGQKSGASATDNASAWATREASGAFRDLINQNPTIANLNEEFKFWKGIQDVLRETGKRTQAQGGGLVAGIGATAGAGAGFGSGESLGDRLEKAAIGGVAGRNVIKLIQSPGFRTAVSAPLKNALADALASGNAARAESIAKSILVASPAQFQ